MTPSTGVRDRVAVGPVRVLAEQAVKDGMTWSDIARDLGWTCGRCTGYKGKYHSLRGDTARLKRALGILPMVNVKKGRTYKKHAESIDYSKAVAIVRACNYDPVDAGL